MICKSCHKEKETNDFYKSDKYHCKDCIKKRVLEYRKNNLERLQEYDRNRPNKEDRVSKCKQYKDRLRQENPEKYDKIFHSIRKRYRAKHSDKAKANELLNEAIRRNKIERPAECSMCKKKCIPQGHHFDYTKPLDVVWLCVRCHSALHKKLREENRNH